MPFRRNPFFSGREPVITRVHELLHAGTAAALAQPPAISGLGGIGKTQTAVEYAYRFRDDYQFVLWVQANSQETLLADFVALATALSLPEHNEQEQLVVVHAMKQWLETHGRWLLARGGTLVSVSTADRAQARDIVQAVIVDELDEKTQRSWAARVVRAVRQVFPFDEPAPWPQSQRYLAHALACEALIKRWDLTLDAAAAVLNYAGWYLRNRGQYQAAQPLLRDALTVGEKRYGVDHPDTSYLLNNLAALYAEQDKHEEAEPLYQRALAIREKMLGPEHPDTISVRENYTALLEKMRQTTTSDVPKINKKP